MIESTSYAIICSNKCRIYMNERRWMSSTLVRYITKAVSGEPGGLVCWGSQFNDVLSWFQRRQEFCLQASTESNKFSLIEASLTLKLTVPM